MICVGYSKRVPDLWLKETVPLKEQNDRIREFAKKNGWKISKFYEDKGNDPKSDAGFQKLRLDGMNRRFDLVIIDSVWRCGRNPMFAKELLLRTFFQAGIHFVILEDKINSMEKNEKELEEYFSQACLYSNGHKGNAKKYRELSSDNRIDCMKERYGYVLNEDRTKMLIDKEAAPVIRKIFDMAEAGKTWREIAEYMNQKGIESPGVHIYRIGIKQAKSTGGCGKWIDSTVSDILRVKAYVGMEEKQVGGTVTYPAIITKEQYERVSTRFRDQSSDNGRARAIACTFKSKITYEDTNDAARFTLMKVKDELKVVLKGKGAGDPAVPYEEVLNQIAEALKKEKEQALRVRKKIESGEAKRVWEEIFYSRRPEAQQLFQQAMEAQSGNIEIYLWLEEGKISAGEYKKIHGEIMERQRMVNERFEVLMDELDAQRKLLTAFNPWVRKFSDCDYRKRVNRRTLSDLIDNISVWGDGTVKVLLNTQGKEVFPKEWLEDD